MRQTINENELEQVNGGITYPPVIPEEWQTDAATSHFSKNYLSDIGPMPLNKDDIELMPLNKDNIPLIPHEHPTKYGY